MEWGKRGKIGRTHTAEEMSDEDDEDSSRDVCASVYALERHEFAIAV